MIKFFRHIRRSFINENRMGKYFKYAIGEILLVVIGILIALQINNWNENRKDRKLEIDLLEQLTEDLRQNVVEFDRSIERNKTYNNAWNMVIKALKENVPFNDSISKHFEKTHGLPILSLNYTSYETIKSKGIYTISDEQLRKDIQQLFRRYESLEKFLVRVNDEAAQYLNPFQQKEQIVLAYPYKGRNNQPRDYEALKSNFEFINTLQDNSNNLISMAIFCDRLLEYTKKVLDDINDQLSKAH